MQKSQTERRLLVVLPVQYRSDRIPIYHLPLLGQVTVTSYLWRSKYGGFGLDQRENITLKTTIVETLNKKDLYKKKMKGMIRCNYKLRPSQQMT